MEKINRIVYDAASLLDAAEAYEQLRQIWDIPPWDVLVNARMGNYEPLRAFMSRWDGKSSPFRGPKISFPTYVENKKWGSGNIFEVEKREIVIETDVNNRRITIKHNWDVTYSQYTLVIDFGDEGSVFAAGDVLARLLKITRTTQYRAQVMSVLTDGSDREPDFPIFPGMAHEWSLAQAWSRGELTETELLEELEKLATGVA